MYWLSRMCKNVVLLTIVGVLVMVAGCAESQTGGKKACAKAKKACKVSEPTADWTLQFSDNFERAELGKKWEILGGTWEIKDGWLDAPGSDWGGSEIMTAGKFPGSQRLEFDSKSDNPCDLTSIICGSYGYWDGYFMGFGSNDNSHSKLLVEGAEVKQWDSVITPGKVHHQIVERDGDTIKHVLDGKTVMTYKHSNPLKGENHQKIGFYIWTSGQIDNVKIYTKRD